MYKKPYLYKETEYEQSLTIQLKKKVKENEELTEQIYNMKQTLQNALQDSISARGFTEMAINELKNITKKINKTLNPESASNGN